MAVRAYLRASTQDQNASRAKQQLADFAKNKGLVIVKYYTENASGAALNRPKLDELLSDCNVGDILLIESIDRLTRLNDQDWQKLKTQLKTLSLKLVILDIPTSHQLAQPSDELQQRINNAVNDMFIELFATFARQDYEQRRKRQAQGIAKAKQQGKYTGRKTNTKRYEKIIKLLKAEHSHREIIQLLNCSPNTISNAKKWAKENRQERTQGGL